MKPSVRTVKRLFAVSGNRCAFPACTAALVDELGSVTGEICHIRAKSPEGPRYAAEQSEEARHGFDNLLLMCHQHHKRIDDDWHNYPCEALLKIKRYHETNAPSQDSPDEVAVALLENSGFHGNVDQTAGGHGVNVAAAGNASVVVHVGLTYDEVRQVARDVYNANALELAGNAERIARERADRLVSDLLEKLRVSHPKPPAALGDPDMQSAIFEAQRTAARVDGPEVADLLVGLLVDRANQPTRDLLQVVLSEAVSTVGRLTPGQFDALTIVFLLKHTCSHSVRDLPSLAIYLRQYVWPFLASAADTRASFQHLEYAGCGAISLGSRDLGTALGQNYPHCFLGSVAESDVIAAVGNSMGEQVLKQLLKCRFFTRTETTALRLSHLFDTEAEMLCASVGVGSDVMEKIWGMLRAKVKGVDVLKDLRGAYEQTPVLEKWWAEFPTHFQLTSVGIAIAHANLRRKGLKGFNLAIWIN